jgi:hypothetical protein
MRIKKFNEEWNPFKEEKVKFHKATTTLIKDLDLPYEEKEEVQRYQLINKDGWSISIRNPLLKKDGKIRAFIDTAFNGLYVDRNIFIEDLEEYLSNFNFASPNGQRPLAFGGWGAEHHVNTPRVPLWPGDRGHDLPRN